MNKSLSLLSASILCMTLAHCGGTADDGDTSASTEQELGRDAGAMVEVRLGSMSFSRPSLSVARGTTVRFRNISANTHTVTSGSGSSDPGAGAAFDRVVAPGKSVSITFTAAGAQPYFCRPHERMGMKGVVTVL